MTIYRFDEHADSACVVHVKGDLDVVAAPGLREQLQELVASGFRKLVVDLADVAVVDSSGLSALIGGLRAARVAGGDVRIARPAEPIRKMLRRSMLDAVLTPYNTVGDALVGFR
jgi:anti-anti-sigma factor